MTSGTGLGQLGMRERAPHVRGEVYARPTGWCTGRRCACCSRPTPRRTLTVGVLIVDDDLGAPGFRMMLGSSLNDVGGEAEDWVRWP